LSVLGKPISQKAIVAYVRGKLVITKQEFAFRSLIFAQ
jgi:hypothetical protein